MKRDAKRVVRLAESLGYVYADTNCKGVLRYVHPDRADLAVAPWMVEHAARGLTRDLLAAAGSAPAAAKRNPAAIRGRRARDRAEHRREQQAHQDQLAALLAERDRMLAGHGQHLTACQIGDIEASIERHERELARYARLMTEVPSTAEHVGTARARHRAGAR